MASIAGALLTELLEEVKEIATEKYAAYPYKLDFTPSIEEISTYLNWHTVSFVLLVFLAVIVIVVVLESLDNVVKEMK